MKTTKESNLFRHTAWLYDLDDRSMVKDDIDFYCKRAADLGGPILELACGTGRVSIPLATAGYEVWGIDLSQEMLAQMRSKVRALPEEVRERINLVHADMSEVDLDKEFPLIIIPFRGFQALTLDEQQGSCLDAVYRHLSGNGRFIIDAFRPYSQLDLSWIHPETLDWEMVELKTGCKVRRTNIRRHIDVQRQVIYPELIYYITEKNGSVQRLVEPLELKYYYENQLRNLLQAHGFKTIEEMGYYDGCPIGEGSELIFVCNK